MKNLGLSNDTATIDDLVKLASTIRLMLPGETGLVRIKMERTARLMDEFVNNVPPLVQSIEDAVLDLNKIMEEERGAKC